MVFTVSTLRSLVSRLRSLLCSAPQYCCSTCSSGEEYLSIPDHTAGSVQLHHGQISGLYTLRRKGEARMHSDSDGATIEAKLALQQVRLCYDFSAKVRER